MNITVSADHVYDGSGLPEYSWEKYQRGFLGILNNAYNQSCNCGKPKLGCMSDIDSSFAQQYGAGSWQQFIRFYIRSYDGHDRVQSAIDAMTQNLIDRTRSIGGVVDQTEARFWSRKYIWSMLANTYRGFCSERTAIQLVASVLDRPYSITGDEPAGIDGRIGTATIQVKPTTYMGLDINDHDADYVITYELDDDIFAFDVPDEIRTRT